jgi:hypothetical protein
MLAAIVGYLIGTMAVAAMTRWAGLVYFAFAETRDDDGRMDKRRGVKLATCQSLFHAGPWSVAVALFVAWHIRSEPYAPWLFGGFLLGFLWMVGKTVRIVRQLRQTSHA